MKTRIKALKQFLGCKKKDIEHLYDNTFEAEGAEYLVVTDDEANDLWDEHLESYIDECILSELNERYHDYFNRELWKSDAEDDGRGHSLSSYDGDEHEVELEDEGETYYIYRVN